MSLAARLGGLRALELADVQAFRETHFYRKKRKPISIARVPDMRGSHSFPPSMHAACAHSGRLQSVFPWISMASCQDGGVTALADRQNVRDETPRPLQVANILPTPPRCRLPSKLTVAYPYRIYRGFQLIFQRHAAEMQLFDDGAVNLAICAIQKDTTSCTIKAHTTPSITVEISQSLFA